MKRNTISWNFYGKEIENHSSIQRFLEEAARLGFSGVQAQLRDYHYSIDQPQTVAAVKYSRDACHRLGLEFWLHLDPRDAVTSFLARYPSARQHTLMPTEAALQDSSYRLCLDYSRVVSDHKQHCSYDFEAVERIFAFRLIKRTGVAEEIAAPLFADTGYINFADRRAEVELIDSSSLFDITPSAIAIPDREKRNLVISGNWSPPRTANWRILAFVRLSLDTFDYASAEAIEFQHYLIDLYREALGDDLYALDTDEPGHPYPYHYLTPKNGYFVSDQFFQRFEANRGYDLRDRLYALVRETSDGVAGKNRFDYFTEWGSAIYQFQKDLKDYTLNSFGPNLKKIGIHANASEWSAADLQKGALNYWKLTETVTDGYSDGKHHDRYNALFHITMAKSLAKLSDSKEGYTQTWDMFPTADSETYWSNVAATYGLRWEPLGDGQGHYVFAERAGAAHQLRERWENLSRINERMSRLEGLTGGAVAEANVLTIFPLETIMRLGNEEANHLRRVSHLLAYQLQATHYQADVMTADLLVSASIDGGQIRLGDQRYDTLIYPFPGCMPQASFEQIARLYENGGRILLFGCPPSETTEGEDLCPRFSALLGIRPVTRLYDYIEPDPTTPYTGTVSFVGDLAGVPTVNIREGMFAHVPMHHYFWPVIPTDTSPSALNFRWMPEPIWLGCVKQNDSGGKLVFLGFDCTCLVDSSRLFDHLLRFLDTPRLVQAPSNLWASLVRTEKASTILSCRRDGLEPFSGEILAEGHTIEIEGAENVLAVSLGHDGDIVGIVTDGARNLVVDGAVQDLR